MERIIYSVGKLCFQLGKIVIFPVCVESMTHPAEKPAESYTMLNFKPWNKTILQTVRWKQCRTTVCTLFLILTMLYDTTHFSAIFLTQIWFSLSKIINPISSLELILEFSGSLKVVIFIHYPPFFLTCLSANRQIRSYYSGTQRDLVYIISTHKSINPLPSSSQN